MLKKKAKGKSKKAKVREENERSGAAVKASSFGSFGHWNLVLIWNLALVIWDFSLTVRFPATTITTTWKSLELLAATVTDTDTAVEIKSLEIKPFLRYHEYGSIISPQIK
ncbi:MAG: hypothetical protein MUC72_00750 [Acidobacteria bacterium]|jgi:hypothetical protein|nr:hypothetical protein [Acidobacteriota bacterium]